MSLNLKRPFTFAVVAIMAAILAVWAVSMLVGGGRIDEFSARKHATLRFCGFVKADGEHYASNRISNISAGTVKFYTHSIEVRSNSQWICYRSHEEGQIGASKISVLLPGGEIPLLVPCPPGGVEWRFRVGVLREGHRIGWTDRGQVFLKSLSLRDALTLGTNGWISTGNTEFHYVGMLQSTTM